MEVVRISLNYHKGESPLTTLSSSTTFFPHTQQFALNDLWPSSGLTNLLWFPFAHKGELVWIAHVCLFVVG